MTTLLSLLPLLLVIALLASGRVSALVAGLAGLAATLAASATLVMGSAPDAGGTDAVAALFRREVPAGLWLSWHVIAIVVTGVFFHRANQARAVAGSGGDDGLAGEGDGDFLAGRGGTPDGDADVALEDHVVGEDGGE